SASSFGEMSVSYNGAEYKVTKIKVNKKKRRIQIRELSGADQAVVKEIRKVTRGDRGLSFTVNPYYVKASDSVVVTKKKDGSLKSVKVMISGKQYKSKKSEWSYDIDSGIITFKGGNLGGSYKI
ncbi:MAG: hypothetical protein J6O55_02105, partial [Lachnospiraceae bacterium]|nr:hypothetical protein [Lachnospiraceae bacterium]